VVLVVSNHHNLEEIKSFSRNINEVTVYASAELKCLGLILDSRLTWKNHITNLVKKCYMRIRAIYSVRSYSTPEYLKVLGQSLVLSLIYYMCPVWGLTSQKNLNLVEKVIRSLARLVLNKRKFDTIAEEIATDLKWFFPSDLNQYTSLCLMYKIVTYKIDYFNDYFTPNSLIHPYYTRLRTNLHCTGVPRTNYGTSTF